MSSPALRVPIALLAILLGLLAVPAQASNGQINGSVTINGVPTPAVRVAAFATGQDLLNEAPAYETVSKKGGSFVLRVAAGEYRIVADAGDRGHRPVWWGAPGGTAVIVGDDGVVSGVDLRVSGTASFPTATSSVPVPASPPGLDSQPLDDLAAYQGQTRCRKKPRPGTVLLRQLILSTYPSPAIPAYLNRPCASDTSEHYDGRAIDWMMNSRIAAQARLGDTFAAWVSAGQGTRVGTVARRLGIMYIIWRGRIWKQYQADLGWQPYSDCTRRARSAVTYDNECHRNHIHISLTQDGARQRTSWWRAAALE